MGQLIAADVSWFAEQKIYIKLQLPLPEPSASPVPSNHPAGSTGEVAIVQVIA
jgi:hypothetical protein